MKLPDGSTLMHGRRPYDPAKAREYYLRTRKLKGRQKGSAQVLPGKPKASPAAEPKPKKKARTTDQKLASIRAKLDLLARSGGKSDYASRTQAEKADVVRKQKETRAAAAKTVQDARKELAELGRSLKKRMSEKAPPSQTEALKRSIEEKQKELDEAVEKLNSLNQA